MGFLDDLEKILGKQKSSLLLDKLAQADRIMNIDGVTGQSSGPLSPVGPTKYDIDSETIQNLVQGLHKPVHVQSIDLSTARLDTNPLAISVPGRSFVIYGYTTSTATQAVVPDILVNVRINENRPENQFPAKHNRGFKGDFYKLYLSWPAQSATSANLVIHHYDDEPWQNEASALGSPMGTVTSVGLADGSGTPIYTISGSPVIAAGVLTFTLVNENANSVFAGPTAGGAAQPTFRALVAADLPAGTGTVTSVGLSMPAIFSVAGSPITTSGTFTVTLATETANFVFAGPTAGGAATPTFRALVTADMPAGTGTVTSVGLSMPAIFSVAGSPVTTSGTLAVTLATETANFVFAGPTAGGAATPTFRALVTADMPAGLGTVTSIATTYPISGGTITGSGTLTSVSPYDCGRLSFVSTTAIKFVPFNGDLIRINGVLFQIPSAGIAGINNTSVFVGGVAAQNLAASTLYYVYAFSNAGAVTADFSTTAHSASSTAGNIGTEIKTGDNTRTLIGMIRTNGSSQFADGVTQRFTRTWFNRIPLSLENAFTQNRTTASTTYVEINSEIRVEFLVWSDEVLHAAYSGFTFNGLINYTTSALGWNGTVDANRGWASFGTNGENVVAIQSKSGLTEGYNYLTVMGLVSGDTGTWQFFASGNTLTKGALIGHIARG